MFKEKDKLTNKFNSSIIIFERQRSKYLFHIRIKFKKKLLSIFDNKKKKKNKPLFPKTKKKWLSWSWQGFKMTLTCLSLPSS